ncbi:hypothetical protein CC78DRAFT_547755 [Lojkania enalia]|uniref:Uncharacterized protein n=1 Tax=Lojkania enalia TaxID=147567 RepID=A0A9P4N612_9PLEO|nr:hypothetical protein CC78DRAFT_547755 [Didymosphaeria enalia]
MGQECEGLFNEHVLLLPTLRPPQPCHARRILDPDSPRPVIILTTATDRCSKGLSPVFKPVLRYLKNPPYVQHIYLDYSVLSLAAATTPDDRISCDLMLVGASSPNIAGAIGKRFSWDPKRSSLPTRIREVGVPASFGRSDDLIRDFWAWTELHIDPMDSPSISSALGGGSDYHEVVLRSTNAEEKNSALFSTQDEDERLPRYADDETLVMLFQWTSHADADRFKNPLEKSCGVNGQSVGFDIWDYHVDYPVRQMKDLGAKVESYRLELRRVEARTELARREVRERSGSRRLRGMAVGLGETVSGLWG